MSDRIDRTSRISRNYRTRRLIDRIGRIDRNRCPIGGAGPSIVTRRILARPVFQGIDPRPETIGVEPGRNSLTIDDEEVLAGDPFPVLPRG
jgi:hypothetical protein